LAKSWFVKDVDQPGSPSAAALMGLGKVALAQHQYAAALKYFKEALAREPQASSIHYQLAMTYRALGDTAQMKKEMEERGDREVTIKDPLLDQIDLLKQGKVALLERATKAVNEGRFADAAASYREMIRIDPHDAIAYRYLGVALAKSGKPTEALESYQRALELDPNSAAVHDSMGVLLVRTGKQDAAIEQFRQACRLDPGLVTAHFQLANLLMRKGEDVEAAREYAQVVDLDPRNGFARLMQAMALIHSGEYAQAREVLEDASQALPSDPDIANTLARLLAAAPDAAVRDENQALRIVESLVQNQQGDAFEVGVTLAMSLAAAGRFKEAAAYQQALIQESEKSGESDFARRLRRNLDLYSHQKACTVPWSPDDPIFHPAPDMRQASTGN
jgi:Flp pilus assembly protein TadD